MFKWLPRKPSAMVALIAFALQLLIFAPSASAKWDDQSDELEFGGPSTALIIVGVVAVGVLIYVLATKGDKEEKDSGDEPEESSQPQGEDTSSATATGSAGMSSAPVYEDDSPRLNYFLAVKSPTHEFGRELPVPGLDNTTLEIGFAIGF